MMCWCFSTTCSVDVLLASSLCYQVFIAFSGIASTSTRDLTDSVIEHSLCCSVPMYAGMHTHPCKL
jgi:hypothetical protein